MSFDGFDLSQFWEHSEYANKEYVDAPLTEEKIAAVETELGYKLPSAYVELCGLQNGGFPVRCMVSEFIGITGIYSIGRHKRYSLCGEFGSKFWINEWDYPNLGIYFADCPSAGHDMLCLDYSSCGPNGEPQVVHVDQESDYEITFVASDFETFIRELKPEPPDGDA